MSTKLREKPLACQDEWLLYFFLISWLAVFSPWAESICISSLFSACGLVILVGCRWSCVGKQDRGTFSKNLAPPQCSVICWVSVDSSQSTAVLFLLPAYSLRYTPLEAVHDTLHRCRCQPRGGGGEDNVCSHCISLCSLIIYPCRQRQCHICIQVRRGVHTRLTSDSLIFPQPVYFRFRVLCENDRWNTDYLYSGS